MIEHVRFCLQEKTPFLMLRYGDSEAMVLNWRADSYSYKKTFKNQTGYELDNGKEIHGLLVNAFKNADIVGLERKVINKDEYYRLHQQEIFEREVGNPQATCSQDEHMNLLNSGDIYTLIKEADGIAIISARDITEYLPKDTIFIKIPGENKYDPIPESHYPDRFKEICKQIRSLDLHGKLVLVGGGMLGKHYANLAWQQGGVVLDIGSVFDLWVGKVTRGVGRSPTAYNDKYLISKFL